MRLHIGTRALPSFVSQLGTDSRAPTHSFWSSVASPVKFRETVVDHRMVSGFDVVRRVSLGYTRQSDEMAVDHYVAFLRPANDRLIVGLAVESGSGRTLRLLSDEGCTRLVALAVRQRLTDLSSSYDEGVVNNLMIRLLELVAAQGPAKFNRSAIDARQAEVTARARELLLDLGPVDVDPGSVDDIATFVGVAAVRDLLVCEVPAGDAGVVTYEMRESISEVKGNKPGPGDRAALALGAIPSKLYIPLYKASKSSGYRLEVDVGPGNYVRSVAAPNAEGLDMTGTGGQLASLTARSPTTQGTDAIIEIAEHPSKTMFSSVLLSFATVAAILGAWLARDSLAPWRGDSLSLGDLGTLLGIVAVAAGSIRAVIYRGLEGRTLAYGALVSAFGSALLLLFLAATLVWLTGHGRGSALTILLIVAAGSFLAVTIAFWCAVRRLANLRSETSRSHPETPASNEQSNRSAISGQ